VRGGLAWLCLTVYDEATSQARVFTLKGLKRAATLTRAHNVCV
jgi:hypothetical protein